MKVYRSPMEKKMDDLENETVITNPNEPVRTFFRKLGYRWEVCKDWLKHPFAPSQKRRPPGQGG